MLIFLIMIINIIDIINNINNALYVKFLFVNQKRA